MKIRLAGVVLLIAAAVLMTVAFTGGPAGASSRPSRVTSHTTTSSATAKSTCPKGTPAFSTCVTIPAHCPTKNCPEVIADPTSGLAITQAVYLQMKNFTRTSDSIYIQYCQDVHPLSVAAPMCVATSIAELPNPQVELKPFPNGTENYAYQVLYLASGSTPFSGVVPGTKKFGTFLCDSASPCSIDVTDPYLGPGGNASALTPTPDNTAVIPVKFAAEENGCARASFINTESEFGIDSLLAASASATCKGSRPVADSNVDLDAPSAVSAFVEGNMPVSFTDSPDAPQEQAALASIKGQYAFIPVALSADVIGFQAIAQGQQGYPDTSFKLTPNMAAGVMTDYYNTSYSSDLASCGWVPGGQCALTEYLNEVSGLESPLEYGSYVRGDASTPTYALFQWMCDAPRVPVQIGTHKVTEPDSAFQVLNYAWTLNGLKALKSCPSGLDQFPGFQKNVPNFGTASNPAGELSKIEGFVPLPQDSTTTAHAGFSDMSWADAFQYGLSIASLQNAEGQFVTPSTASLEAAAKALHEQPNGVYSFDYSAKVKGAYPMPDVWYALVSTKPQDPSEVATERGLIDDLLAVSGGADKSSLPTAYAPLPASIYKAALADVTKDITSTGKGGNKVTPGAPTVTVTTTSIPAVTTTTVPVAAPTTTAAPAPPTTGTATTVPVTTTAPKPTTSTKLPSQLASFVLTGRSDAWMPGVFAGLLGAGFLFGPGLLFRARRKKAASRGNS